MVRRISFPNKTEATYKHIQDPSKAPIELEGANHLGITDENNPDNPLTTSDEVLPILIDFHLQTIPQEIAIDTIATWSSLF